LGGRERLAIEGGGKAKKELKPRERKQEKGWMPKMEKKKEEESR